jgi:hypothetical protein
MLQGLLCDLKMTACDGHEFKMQSAPKNKALGSPAGASLTGLPYIEICTAQ